MADQEKLGSILAAVEKVDAGTIKARTQGLEGLRELFGRNRSSSQVVKLSDESTHTILESLFRLVQSEKPKYVRASTKPSQNSSAMRLEDAAEALRVVLDAVADRLKQKTASAVLDHIVDILPDVGGGLCSPIAMKYLQCFNIILSHDQKGEHLRHKQWQSYVDFIIDNLTEHIENESNNEIPSSSKDQNLSFKSGSHLALRVSQSSDGKGSRQKSSKPQEKILLTELLTSLKHLTSITNAPLVTKYEKVSNAMMQVLRTVHRSEELVFEVLTQVLPTALSENILLAANICNEACQIICQRDLWLKKSVALKENMLAFWILCRSLLLSTNWVSSLIEISTLEDSLGMMRNEYDNTLDRDRLQLEDLAFRPSDTKSQLSLNGINLVTERTSVSETLRVVNTWASLHVMALLILSIAKKRTSAERNNGEELAPKRRRLQNPVHDVFYAATNPNDPAQLVALQLSVFVVDQQKSVSPKVADLIHRMQFTDLEDEPIITSWTCLLLAGLSALEISEHNFKPEFWKNVWSWAIRASTATSTSRAACYLLHKMTQSRSTMSLVSSQTVCDTIFPDGTSGPTTLSDAAFLLITGVLSSDILDNEKTFKHFASHSLRWLDHQWTVSSVLDRPHNAQIASFAQTDMLYTLIMSAVGHHVGLTRFSPPVPISNISKALSVDDEDLLFVDYVLIDATKVKSSPQPPEPVDSTYTPSPIILSHLKKTAMDMLTSKIRSFYSACKMPDEERPSHMSTELIEIATTACALGYAIAASLEEERNIATLHAAIRPMWDLICSSPTNHTKDDEFINDCLRIAMRLTSVQSSDVQVQNKISASRAELSQSVLALLEQRLEPRKGIGNLDQAFMDVSELRTSQNSYAVASQTASAFVRSNLSLPSDTQTLIARQSMILKLDLIRSQIENDPSVAFSTLMVDAVCSSRPEDLLATRDIVIDVLEKGHTLTRVNAAQLLTKLAEVYLQKADYERCEAALCFCLHIATQLAPLWTAEEDDDLGNVGYDIYQWFIDVALRKGIASARVLLSIAALLNSVLHCNPSYGAESLPSARTSLLQILGDSLTGLKFRLIEYLSNLFNGYVLSEHSAVFDDIIESLPSDPDRREGISLRLYTIASLGARWHTILRESVYHIFETAANVPTTATIAAKCIHMVCDELGLNSPRQLLQLFSPQVLYTWLSREGMEKIPFGAFGFETLTALEIDIQEELVAQVAMRVSTEHAQSVVRSLGTSWDGLIERWFAKAMSYSTLTDVAASRTSREIGKAEMSLVQQMGEEVYAKLCRMNLAKAFSTVLLRLSDDRGFEKTLSQDDSTQGYAETYRLICARSSSQMELPPGQQPSFRAKHLIQILDRICMRAQETIESVWTPALLIHVYRGLLADAKPAFGPLHTCAILRKIRVVVCLAGKVALSGYPLQMLLYALRPFLTRFHSSEDAFGIFWYLLEYGKDCLQHKLPFVTGLSVAIFASLSRFTSSSQDSTTQESHFVSTMSKAQDFRLWLGAYLEGFNAAELTQTTGSTFEDVLQAAKQITKPGSSGKATAEGNLLYHLLEDQASPQPLLSNTFFHLTLRSLCDNFTAISDPQDDILFKDADVLRIAPILWSVLNHQKSQDSFRVWILQALGRAYALQGPTISELEKSRQLQGSPARKSDNSIEVENSYQYIANRLGDVLWDENDMSASAAEATLQSIFSALPPENREIVLGHAVDQSMFDELRFTDLPCPSLEEDAFKNTAEAKAWDETVDGTDWACKLVEMLSKELKSDPVLAFLPALIDPVPTVAPLILPQVVHLSLHFEIEKDQSIKVLLTDMFGQIFDANRAFSKGHIQLALETIVYLRRCALPFESTMAKRNTWLTIDFGAAAAAAFRCEMYRTALLMLEIHASQNRSTSSRSSRRSSVAVLNVDAVLLNQIYQNVDDPDFFYGTHGESDITSIVQKLCHEGHGYKALSFQSALFDSNIRTGGMDFALNESGITTISALNLANLNGLSNAIGSFVTNENQDNALEHSLQSILNLRQWDVAQDKATPDHGTALMTALRTLSSASLRQSITTATDQSTLKISHSLLNSTNQRAQQIKYWTSLAVLAELKEVCCVTGFDDLATLLQTRSLRRPWTEQESFECVEPILLGREAMFAIIKNNSQVRKMIGVTAPQAVLLEVKSLRASLSLGHVHEMSQFCLNRAAYLSELLPHATELGVKVEAAIKYDLANTFWAQHETAASIRILERLHEQELPNQAIEVQQSEILTDLGSKISEARLDRPDEVTSKYLIPAINALGKESMGSKVGRVFHNFAAFCDSQLRDPDNMDEYERVQKIRDRKSQEVLELQRMYKKGDSKTRDTVKAHFAKAKTWLDLDDEELKRLKAHRETLVRNCLENYLLSLRACEDFPNDVLRFLALWMEQSASPPANTSVSKYLSSVPTYKFAPLMNQLSSRILNEDSPFQQLLSDLMYHICEDHPFHSLHQVFATSKSRGAQKDEVANSRHAAATKLSEKVMKKSSVNNLWFSIHNSNIQFVRVAQEKFPDKELKTGAKLLLRKLPQGEKLEQTIRAMHHKIPPPTMKIDIRPKKDYSSVPTIAKFDPQISIAGGVSAPKIITIIASDGSRHKMLLKGGNDDLRQDSIMEQVFEQVSNLLMDHRATRQRKLGIRTYKVIPLTHNAGIIEFVRDTMPLHDYVLPAHTRYYPKDYKPNKCRKEIADAQSKPLSERLQAYRNVVSNFHPVMRFFFMEHFLDPDDWFQKRLNYSRSTAAISMLGHALGLGDRHGHNILLDTKTGEVVHIDLGVAFEAGRVLPVPEVVPFRLTRDLVDGMGLSGVEGVFRRCCNFTLEALRRNQEAIMTILDVLRWDPLYSWSVSPLRLARMQENQEQAAAAETSATGISDVSASTTTDANAVMAAAVKRNNFNEPSEADRALAVVSKKLGKSLSVEATVNELIRQAMDERNLAVLYCGWAAYA